MRTILSILLLFFCGLTFAQTTITGTVVDDSSQPIPGANIIVVGTFKWNKLPILMVISHLLVTQDPPFSLQASSVGFESVTEDVTSNNQTFSYFVLFLKKEQP